jgi:hypothetical protein
MADMADDQFNDGEAARRRDEVIKRMLNTPPRPRRTTKPKKRPTQKGRVHKAKYRS